MIWLPKQEPVCTIYAGEQILFSAGARALFSAATSRRHHLCRIGEGQADGDSTLHTYDAGFASYQATHFTALVTCHAGLTIERW